MTVHLLKLSVGSESAESQAAWVKRRVAYNKKRKWGAVHDHTTRMFPRRREELLDGGSIYWVIKGVVLVRQKILDLKSVTGADGIERCAIILEPEIVATEAQPRRAFQGWRYLDPQDAPRDASASGRDSAPPELRAELAELGLL
ncbi:MAG: DUF1489 domain-containing protein [Pseudomonadota bacterium]